MAINRPYTYLMSDGRFYKIGSSLSPFRRTKELQTANPFIRLLGYTKKYSESNLHERFKRWKVGGEWFNIPKYDVDLLLEDMHKTTKETKKELSKFNIRDINNYVIGFGRYKGRMLNSLISEEEINYIRKQIKSLKKTSNTGIMFSLWYKYICEQNNI